MLRLFLLAGLGAMALRSSAAELVLTLRPTVLLSTPQYTVADVAAIESAEPAVAARIGVLRVGVMKPGGREYLWRNQITRVIEAQYPELRGHVAWSGEPRTELRLAGVPVNRAQVEQLARTYLMELLRREHERVELQAIAAGEPLLLPAGPIDLRPRFAGAVRPARRMCVWIDVLVNGAPYRAVPVWFEVSARRVVLRARAALPAGSIVAREQFIDELREVQGLSGEPATLPSDTGAVRLKRALQAGQMLAKEHLEAVPAVARNQEITVLVESSGIRLETAGIALADGQVGTMIRVRNPASQGSFAARVVDDGVVAVIVR